MQSSFNNFTGNKGFYWILGGCVFVVLTGLIIMSVVIIYYKRVHLGLTARAYQECLENSATLLQFGTNPY